MTSTSNEKDDIISALRAMSDESFLDGMDKHLIWAAAIEIERLRQENADVLATTPHVITVVQNEMTDQIGRLQAPTIEVLRSHLCALRPSGAVVLSDSSGWSAYLTGLPFFTAHGDNHDEVVNDLIVALREYAEDWNDHLHTAPNHREHWMVVTLTELSTNEQLKAWLLAGIPSNT